MSKHIELKDDEFLNKGLRLHGLSVDTPSQLSDAFRSGALYACANTQESSAAQGAMTAGWIQYIDGVQTQNFARTESDLSEIKKISSIAAAGRKIEYTPVYFAQPSDATAQPIDLTDERAAFEAWQVSLGFKRPEDAGEWDAWQARALLANTAQGKPEQGDYVMLPKVMTAAMINAWSNGPAVSTDDVALHTPFQAAWTRVINAALAEKKG